ncbi:uncharacterized protein MONOS_16188 [Monocercomonoides exilis]|uniref:uncharacterized protein n=1 Tax=Monocercomonoides exilis TaxID=2049356 RepID=UPI00355A0EE8|nr:hypothetical protein MONOS_16188 [Monocercomonoides exilis]|eukprot:MONOS_16188.1-p1 / transcript=MONOS_16188.1 / gene=MONOS_16188 / organism=Monocercomonoides_exilis_PA203 / gene_product=unspecified product / transcript_product=unspecified product / location=Mono_scaffold01554:1111-2133(+) / protein_length=341 / sequence_SO=supercontig / SO=protein_coding / is_pseudo=false
MRRIQFISCSTVSHGRGPYFYTFQQTTPSYSVYCYFLFFHECKCSAATPYGRDVMYYNRYNVFKSSNNPFDECYTTNADDQRVCYRYWTSDWAYQLTDKKEWLNEWTKVLFVGVNGSDSSGLCGMGESAPCQTVGHAVETGLEELSSSVTLMGGYHTSETATIEIGTKKISVIGKGRTKSSIETGALSLSGALFSVSAGHLGMNHLKVDCNSNINPSPSVVVVSDGGGSLSLEDVVITTSKTGDYVILSSVFVVALSQLSMVDVEIINMNVSKSLFSEPNQSSSSLSSSALYLTATASGDSELANVKVTNVKLTEGDGVVVAKSVKAGKIFTVQYVTIDD